MCQKQKSGQKDGAKWVNMANWIEADTPEPRRSFITEELGNKSVSGFVKCNGDKNRQEPD